MIVALLTAIVFLAVWAVFSRLARGDQTKLRDYIEENDGCVYCTSCFRVLQLDPSRSMPPDLDEKAAAEWAVSSAMVIARRDGWRVLNNPYSYDNPADSEIVCGDCWNRLNSTEECY